MVQLLQWIKKTTKKAPPSAWSETTRKEGQWNNETTGKKRENPPRERQGCRQRAYTRARGNPRLLRRDQSPGTQEPGETRKTEKGIKAARASAREKAES
jgi:hypothetical protein